MEQHSQRRSVPVVVVGLLLVLCGVPALVWRATAEIGYDVITTYPARYPTSPPVANGVAVFGMFLITAGAVVITSGASRRWRPGSRGR